MRIRFASIAAAVVLLVAWLSPQPAGAQETTTTSTTAPAASSPLQPAVQGLADGLAQLDPLLVQLEPVTSQLDPAVAGLLDGRRALTHPPCSFAPFTTVDGALTLKRFYAELIRGRRVLLADDVRNTGKTFVRCAELVQEAGGEVIATVQICDRLEAAIESAIEGSVVVIHVEPGEHAKGRGVPVI